MTLADHIRPATQPTKETQQPETKKEPQRALIPYRTKPLGEKQKWSEWREREIPSALDSDDAMSQFFDRRTWDAMIGMMEIKQVRWLGKVL